MNKFKDVRIGERVFVIKQGERILVEKTEHVKSGSNAYNAVKCNERKGRVMIYRDEEVTPEKRTIAVMKNDVITFEDGATIDMNEVDRLYLSAIKAVGTMHDTLQTANAFNNAWNDRQYDEADYCGAGW